MSHRSRNTLIAGIASVTAALVTLTFLTTAQAAPRSEATQAAADNSMPSASEGFDYPDAERILQDRKITLKRGDGRILLTDCSNAWDISVESMQAGTGDYCFSIQGKTGYLTLELPRAFNIWTEEHPIRATLIPEGSTEKTTIEVPENSMTSVGEGDNQTGKKRSALVELRATG
ncbi:hypothetical protein ACWDR0_30050 [Streptomyces sp. NPDC003691]